MKITVFKVHNNQEKTYRNMDIQELISEMMGSRYFDLIRSFRTNHPLFQREHGSQRQALISYALRDIPSISFSRECRNTSRPTTP